MKKQPRRKGHSSSASDSDMKFIKLSGKGGLHKDNRHHGRYDFKALVKVTPELAAMVQLSPRGEATIDFSDAKAVKLLNKALLSYHYQVEVWDIPDGYLCPPIPGRADYVHRLAELLYKESAMSESNVVRSLDIGVGANGIYPIIGSRVYGWQGVASDIDPVSIENAQGIYHNNPNLKGKVECRLQTDARYLFKGIIQNGERFHVTTCNPPFHSSAQEAAEGSHRKRTNLTKSRAGRNKVTSREDLNFGGQHNELWCPGGEGAFVKRLAFESRDFSDQVLWFSTLLSKKENVRWMRKNLQKAGAKEAVVVEMSQGQKVSRFVAWTFHTAKERQQWINETHQLIIRSE